MNLENLGARVRKTRLEKGMTQEKLAEKADISLNFMSLIENGRNMSVQTLVNIADGLGVSVQYLLYDKVDLEEDVISQQILQDISALNENEKIYFLNMIKQYKLLKH